MKKITTILIALLFATSTQAQPPGYYTSALGKNGANLQTALKNIIDNHNALPFPLWTSFSATDNKGSNILWDIYSDVPGGTPNYTYTIGSNQCGQYDSEADCYNHEHVWPKTYYNDAAPMRSDLHHVIPTDGWVNNKRGNFPYGLIKFGGLSWTSMNGSMTGTTISYPGYSGNVFEPIDEYKGDIARMYFYTSTRYKGEDASWSNWEMANGAELTQDAIQLLLQWHQNDTVSQKEIDRNNAIYLQQGNRNPFIDYPIFADCIWGTADCTPLDIADILLTEIEVFPNPSQDYLRIKLPKALLQKETIFEVYNTVGQRLIRSTQTKLDIHNLPSGIYSLRLLFADQHASISFIKN